LYIIIIIIIIIPAENCTSTKKKWNCLWHYSRDTLTISPNTISSKHQDIKEEGDKEDTEKDPQKTTQ